MPPETARSRTAAIVRLRREFGKTTMLNSTATTAIKDRQTIKRHSTQRSEPNTKFERHERHERGKFEICFFEYLPLNKYTKAESRK